MADLRTQLRCPAGIWLAGFLVLAGFPGTAIRAQGLPPAVAEEQVAQVRVVGHNRVPLEKILPNIHTRQGRVYDPKVIEDDVRRLNGTKLFITVKPYTQQVPGGRLVVFEVLERPLLHYVKFVGNRKFTKKALLEEASIKSGEAMDVFAVEEARRRLEEYYHTRGFPKAQITLFEGGKPDDQGVVFLINEGTKQRVLWTKFEGNTIATDARLRTQIKTKPGILWIFQGEVDAKEIDEDLNRLTAYYRGLGFFRARIGRELEYDDDREWLTLTFIVDEGPRYVVRNVAFIGNTKFSTDRLSRDLKLKSGQYFNQAEMRSDVSSIRDTYGAVGYVFSDVKADPRFLEEPGQLDLVYNIEEGERYRVGRINVQIKGEYAHTKINTVLNRMSLRPGDIVDIRELRASERRLKASGLFEVDPTKGVAPKIVFSPPTAEDLETSVARQPQRPNGFRGQSPEDPGEDRRIDLTIDGQLIGNTEQGDPQREAESGEPSQSEQPAGRSLPAFPLPPQGLQEPGHPPMVVRGQSPEPAGWTWGVLPWKAVRPIPTTVSAGAASRPSSAPYRRASEPLRMQWPSDARAVAPEVVRGQFSASGGVSIPQLPSNLGRSAVFAPPVTQNYQPAAPTAPTTTTVQQPVLQPLPAAPMAPQTMPPATSAQPMAPYPGQAVPAPQYVQPGFAVPQYAQPGFAPPQYVQPGFPPPGMAPPSQRILRDDPSASNLLGLPPDEGPLWLPLSPELAETQTGRIMFSVGVNSEAGLLGSVVIDEQNFDWTRFPRGWEDIRNATAWRGAGQRFRIEAVPGSQVQKYTINFQEPYLFDTPIGLGLSGYYYDRRYREWDEQRVGGRVSGSYQFTPDLSGVVAFRGANIKIFDPIADIPELNEVLGSNALYGFEIRLIHDTRDSTFLPTEGHLFEVSAEQVIGSFEYPRGEIELRQYFMLHQRPDGSGRHVLSLGGKVAVSGEDTPIYEHYFAGGFTTIRGFDFREASPRNQGIVVGGEFMMLASAEYMFPITADDALRGVVFVDTGTVEPTIDHWTDDYRVAPGFGLRITIPAMGPAPIALDLAFPIAREEGDDIQTFSFFVGFLR
ncbi:MAG: BamA/TamA family outer membrane protein [Pirellulales bacterium]|nr:BamA/TamA family outer membrane protein [Pirellulales bacterium]